MCSETKKCPRLGGDASIERKKRQTRPYNVLQIRVREGEDTLLTETTGRKVWNCGNTGTENNDATTTKSRKVCL